MWSAPWSTKPEVDGDRVARRWRARRCKVPTTALTGMDIDRVVLWAGATLHAPHRAMSAQRGMVPEGVYVAFFAYGSPATRYRLFPGGASWRWMASPRRTSTPS